jgi:hypothetical protein
LSRKISNKFWSLRSPRLCYNCRQPENFISKCLNPKKNQNPGAVEGDHDKKPIFQVKPGQLNFKGNNSSREHLPTSSFTFKSWDEILFQGGRLWCPMFLISLISANDRTSRVKPCRHGSNHGQPGSSPRKPSQQALMTLLIKSTPTCGQPLVKTLSLNFLQNFCRALQISPKHFKISQYKSCPLFWGTQLCFCLSRSAARIPRTSSPWMPSRPDPPCARAFRAKGWTAPCLSRSYKGRRAFPRTTCIHPLPLPLPQPPSSPARSTPQPLDHLGAFPRTLWSCARRPISLPGRELAGARAPAAVANRCRRAPSPASSPPVSGHQSTLGEP